MNNPTRAYTIRDFNSYVESQPQKPKSVYDVPPPEGVYYQSALATTLALDLNPVVRNPRIQAFTNVSDRVEFAEPPPRSYAGNSKPVPILKAQYTTY